MDSKYEILNKIKFVEKKHIETKKNILEKINLIEKTEKELNELEKNLKIVEEEYILLIEKFVEINE
jgi:hypothetical protein